MSWPLHILHLMTMGIQNLPCEQRFLPSMAFNINKVIHVPYQSCTWLVLYTGHKQTNCVRDKPHERLRCPCLSFTPGLRSPGQGRLLSKVIFC